MKFRYDTYCGLYCGACAILLANEKGEVQKKAKEWKMKTEELKCHGCKTETIADFCVTCKLKKCAEDKNVDYCFQCDEYPCARLVEFRDDKWPHHSAILKNLDFMSDKGMDSWLKEQKARWSCAKCGTRFTWYDKTCQNCGEKLYNCEEEEKDFENE